MGDDDVKEVKVNLQPLDAKMLLPGKTRRSRRSKMEGGSSLEKTPTVEPTPASAPAPAPIPEPVAPTSSMSPATIPLPTTPALVGGGATVRIKGKPNMPPPPTASSTKILPKKKLATTFKKQKLVISAPPEKGSKITEVGAHTKKRRFSERRISIEMKPVASTRRHRKDLKDKIATMSAPAIQKFLIRKGVLKPRAGKDIPEDILRPMLKDYLLLHTAE